MKYEIQCPQCNSVLTIFVLEFCLKSGNETVVHTFLTQCATTENKNKNKPRSKK